MDQTHIGYTMWQQPPVEKMPAVAEIELTGTAEMGVAVEGSRNWWPAEKSPAELPVFYPGQTGHYIDIFNRGKTAFSYTIATSAKYVVVQNKTGIVNQEQRIEIAIDWAKAPMGISKVPLVVKGADQTITIELTIYSQPQIPGVFAEHNGYIAIEAQHYASAIGRGTIKWEVISNYGRTLSGVMPSPVTAKTIQPGGNSPHLEYNVSVRDTGIVSVEADISPTIDFKNQKGLYYAISIDDEKPQMVNINSDVSDKTWNKEVAENIKRLVTKHHIGKPGKHVLKYWMVDAGVVLQKLVIDTGGLQPSYLGPPEK